MTDYLLLIHENEAAQTQVAPAEMKRVIEAHAAFAKGLRASGAYKDAERLRPTAGAKRVHKNGVQDGPFAESKEAIGGYYAFSAESLDAATKIANECPLSQGDQLELRPVMSGALNAQKQDQPGKVFAFGVLGSAGNEHAWTKTMDRIDESTHDGFPDDRFLGGVRLQAPSTGKRIVQKDGRRAVIDGPFFESKEVIGGIFFLRFAGMDDAVRWAKGTAFVTHGTLEIRELWPMM
jgi:hypothetical protein